ALILAPSSAGAVWPFDSVTADPVAGACSPKIGQARDRMTLVAHPEMRDEIAEIIERAERERRAEDFTSCVDFADLALSQIDQAVTPGEGQQGPGARVR